MKKIAIFGSGAGSNAENICSFFANSPDIEIVLIGTNNKNAFLIQRAEKLQIPVLVFSKSELNDFEELNQKLMTLEVDYVVLAGFLLKLPVKMIEKYAKKIINIHPSLLPKYGGKGMYGVNIHKAVLKNRETKSGITIHLVNEKYDDGEILLQKSCKIIPTESILSLSEKISALEQSYFPKTIKNYIQR